MRENDVRSEDLHRNQRHLMQQTSTVRGITTRFRGHRFHITGPRNQTMIAHPDGRVSYQTTTSPQIGYIPLSKARDMLQQWRILGEDASGPVHGLAQRFEGIDTVHLAGVPNRFRHLAYRAYVLNSGELEHITEPLIDAALFRGHLMALFLDCEPFGVQKHVAEVMAEATGWEWQVKLL